MEKDRREGGLSHFGSHGGVEPSMTVSLVGHLNSPINKTWAKGEASRLIS
jgi:hypothetical protein